MTEHSDQSIALINRANASAKDGKLEEAVELFQKAVELNPQHYGAWIRLSKLQYQLRHYVEAVESTEFAEECDPLQQDFQYIQQAMQRQDLRRASQLANNMLQQYPAHPRAIFTLSHLFAMQGAHEDRTSLLQQGLEYSPANLTLRRLLIAAHEDCGEFQPAIETAKHLVEIESSFINVWGLMGTYLRHGFNDELLGLSKKAYKLCENDKVKKSEIDLLCGQALKILGRRQECIQAYKSCLKNKPESGAAWWALADMKNYLFSESDKGKMKTLIANMNISVDQRMQACFSLAKAIELDGDLENSVALYKKANALGGPRVFDVPRHAKAIETIIQSFTSDVLFVQSKTKQDGPTPIFIVGLPRSGSTLIEQILASHSQIEGTMEMLVLPSVKRKAHIECRKQFAGSYLENIGRLSSDALNKFGQAYLDGSAIFRKEDKPYFIDKLPYNFEHIGLIHKVLPHALIIDARRNPMDCGFSIFKQYFSAGANYSYNLENIGSYYNGYLKIMDHWDTVLPEKVLRIQYEELVHNTEIKIQEILEFIGVKLEESCLHFYDNKRAVRTASSEQVRQPIFASSIGAWKPIEKELEPLESSLGYQTLKRFNDRDSVL